MLTPVSPVVRRGRPSFAAAGLLALGLACAGPALAAQPAKPSATKPATPKRVIKPDPTLETTVKSVTAALKPGETSDDMVKAFTNALKAKKGSLAVFDFNSVEGYDIPSQKKRIFIVLGYYRTDSIPTKNHAVLAFESPMDDFRGSAAKLLKKSIMPFAGLPVALMRPEQTIKSPHDINKLSQFKFDSAF